MTDKFRNKFLEEANEHIQNIESDLLKLEQTPHDPALIERTFRAMHTLKGGGAMFGFDSISELTHHLETIFDHIRNLDISLSDEILNISFEAVDHLKMLIEDDDQHDGSLHVKQKKLLNKIALLNDNISGGKTIAGQSNDISEKKSTGTLQKTYYIHFQPVPDIFDNGTNPLYIIDELVSLGEHIVIPRFDDIPELEGMIPTQCYTSWEVILGTDKAVEDLQSVFMFVEDDCKLEIRKIADRILLHDRSFKNKLDGQTRKGGKIDLQVLGNLSKPSSVKDEEKKNDNETSLFHQKKRGTKIFSIRIDSDKVDHFMNLVSELVTTQAGLALFANKQQHQELNHISENMQKLTRNLRDLAFNIALIPIDQVVTRFQRLVRDLSRELGKEIDFVTEGTEIELDKNIIESLTDPILHILRNAVDHGIEKPEVRLKNGKSETGKIHFKAYHSGSNVHIQIHDDGKGLDVEKIKQKAIAKRLIAPETELTKKDVFELIFLPGFTTAENVTGVSGRGVGMDVVKRKISEIRGVIEIDSEPIAGTTIIIKLPLTLSIIDGLLVEVEKEKYLISLTAIQKIHPIWHKSLENNFHRTIELDKQLVPYLHLREKFVIEGEGPDQEFAVIVSYKKKKVALIVDSVIGEYQAVLKSLGKHYKHQEMLCGATILGDGNVALVMDTNMMINGFMNNNVLIENDHLV